MRRAKWREMWFIAVGLGWCILAFACKSTDNLLKRQIFPWESNQRVLGSAALSCKELSRVILICANGANNISFFALLFDYCQFEL